MTVAPGARLRQLAEAATRPWEQDERNGRIVLIGHEFRGLESEADARLIALAPSLAVLCADMADEFEAMFATSAKHCRNEHCSLCAYRRSLLARFRALTQEPT